MDFAKFILISSRGYGSTAYIHTKSFIDVIGNLVGIIKEPNVLVKVTAGYFTQGFHYLGNGIRVLILQVI
ncbi:MAG: hypothetical protein FWH42_01990 [Dehalococcoidia bacterium]|nr:hypothetical protein [Dehalococcoidia bacterium]